MRSAVPRRNARPPIPVPGAAGRSPLVRPTVNRRPIVRPLLWAAPGGFPAHHEYVRRYWTAAIGASSVADLLRLMSAAKRRKPIKRPVNLATLARVGLVVEKGDRLFVRSTVPPVPEELWPRLTPRLMRELNAIGGGLPR